MECLDQKTYLAKVDGSTQKSRSKHLYRPCLQFWGPIAAILDFGNGGVLNMCTQPQSVSMFFDIQEKVKKFKTNSLTYLKSNFFDKVGGRVDPIGWIPILYLLDYSEM